jgi:hypothetical protein
LLCFVEVAGFARPLGVDKILGRRADRKYGDPFALTLRASLR